MIFSLPSLVRSLTKRSLPLCAAVGLLASARFAQAQATVFYGATAANGGTLSPQTGATHYMQVVTFDPATAASYSYDTVNLGLNISATTSTYYTFIMDIYAGVDTSATSTNALANATLVQRFNAAVSGAATGNFNFTIDLGGEITRANTSNGTFGVVLTLGDNNYATPTNGINGLFRANGNGPTVGSNTGYVWNDADGNGVFTGAEQTTFGATRTQIYLAFTGRTTPGAVPEPGTIATLGVLGAASLAVAARRRMAAA